MSIYTHARVATLGAIALALTSSFAAAAHCRNLVCVEGRDDGRTLNIYMTSQMSGGTHFNIRAGGRQFESAGKFELTSVKKGRRYAYSVQVCKRGGVLQSSTCGQWATFHHDVK